MIVSDTAVKNRISVVVLAIMILVFGTYCYLTLPRESEPDISIPYVFVSTSYKGVSSADMEISVTIPIEKKLKGLDGVKTISSVSAEGSSQINIEFDPEMDIDTALRKVKDKVDEAKSGPALRSGERPFGLRGQFFGTAGDRVVPFGHLRTRAAQGHRR
jgi:multidrug efflux pump